MEDKRIEVLHETLSELCDDHKKIQEIKKTIDLFNAEGHECWTAESFKRDIEIIVNRD